MSNFKGLNFYVKNKKIEGLIYFYIDLTTIFKIRPCTMRECLEGHLTVSWFHALILRFLTKYGNVNSVFHSDNIFANSKYLSRFVSEMIL